MQNQSDNSGELTTEKNRLLELLLKKKGIRVEQAQAIPRRKGDGPSPLSFAQQRLWFIQQLDPRSWAYNISATVTLRGRLHVAALEQSLSEIVRRHESLRTTFVTVKGEPVQVISEPQRFPLDIKNLSRLPEEERASAAQSLLVEDARRPFDLSQAPPLRATLLRLSEDSHTLLLTMHHIISDGWSLGVFVRELTSLYEHFARGGQQSSPLPALPIQYADYSIWQREWVQGPLLETQLGYWRAELQGAPAHLELPTDKPRPAVQSYQGAAHVFRLDAELRSGLEELSRREGATLFMTVLAGFQALLARYTRQEDVLVGTPVANRQRAEVEGLIGFFVNTLVLRAQPKAARSFRELLAQVREKALAAFAHQDVPFERLVEELRPERELSHTPIFQVLFVMQNAVRDQLRVEGMDVKIEANETGTAKFDVTMEVEEEEGGSLRCRIEYQTELFEAETIKRMGAHFERLLRSALAAPEQKLGELQMLTESEQRQLSSWNPAAERFPGATLCIHELVEQQVARTPDALAVIFGEEQLTFAALNERANRLAHYLRRMGVGVETMVGLCMERSVEMVVAVLAVLKAGAAYVPLDPQYPQERLAFMLEDTGVRVLLAQSRFVERLPEHAAQLVCVDVLGERIAEEGAENLPASTSGENLVYVTYTSGSTGRPKGIAMPQRALVNLLEWQYRYTRMPEGARTLQFASLSFDVSFQDIFSTWCSGGTLALISEAQRRDLTGLAQLIVEQKINRLFIPAVALQQLAEGFTGDEHFSAPLQRVIAGSEQLHITPAMTRMFKGLGHCSLHNEYGPSEAHVVTALSLPDVPALWPQRPSIGRPISNIQIHLLDPSGQHVPVGITGELYIGGVSLARGYMRRPDLTAAQFIPDPFSEQPGARMYKTGDLARYLADGQIEFLGRADHQVKIRGFRVEPGEVEEVLGQHPSIEKSVVMVRDDAQGSKRLVAYVVAAPGESLNVSQLRHFLLEKLPDYMVPTGFMFLDALPLTPNGKVDRRALPVPDQSRPELEQDFVAPRTALEGVLADIWAGVLNLNRIGIHDNFFDLGGHSLLATQVVSRIEEAFQTEIPLRTIFEAPTIGKLAERMTLEEGPGGSLEEIALLLREVEGLSETEAEELLAQSQGAE